MDWAPIWLQIAAATAVVVTGWAATMWSMVLRAQKAEARLTALEKEDAYMKDKLKTLSSQADRQRDRIADNDSRFATLETKLDNIVGMLDKLVDKLDS